MGTSTLQEECDLVMKGGVTSGIVYPPAVLQLKDRYRFRSIGGASAGAIAAAVTAAAEYGRESGGFDRLARASARLGERGALRGLFQPSPEARPLLETLLELSRARLGVRALARALVRNDPRFVARGRWLGGAVGLLVALAAGLVLWWLAPATRSSLTAPLLLLALVFALPLGWLGGLGLSLRHLYLIATDELPRRYYGLCPGLSQAGSEGEALTDWLHATVQDVAGLPLDRPLTFGDLEGGGVHLRMVTSNLAHERPYPLPFDQNVFVFRREEMDDLFPPEVVRALVAAAHPGRSFALPEGYHFLPPAARLPVLVGARLSLSFPLLIAAVPLYTVSGAALRRKRRGQRLAVGRDELQRNWFSDGGISSNFPIHFFDSWLPSRPTFGITLAALPERAFTPPMGPAAGGEEPAAARVDPAYLSLGADEAALDEPVAEEAATRARPERGGEAGRLEEEPFEDAVYLPPANALPRPEWVPVEGLPSFLWAIFSTAQNYRDTVQSMLPSYRERVVQIRLSDEEGGLNLAMDPSTIARVVRKGERAGRTLDEEFDFRKHWWVRFRVLMGQLERELQVLEERLADERVDHARILLDQKPVSQGGEGFPYSRGESWREAAVERLEELRALIHAWGPESLFAQDPPRPEPTLRVTPRL